MQLSDMQAVVSQRLNEGATGPVAYPTSEITAALNEGNRLFVLLTLGLETTQNWIVPAATTYFHMLPTFPDWIVPLRITDATGGKVRPGRITDLSAFDSNWQTSPGPVKRYVYLGCDFIALYQQPITPVLLSVTYARAPLPLALAADVPEVPAEYHPGLVDYAIYRLRQNDGGSEFQKALPLFDNFLERARHYADYVRSRNLGSRYDAVPFEMQRFDRSQLHTLRPDLVPLNKPAGV